MTTPLIEAIARALHDGDHPDDILEWSEHSDSWRANYARSAQAALTAITEAGYAVVPVEPTKAMLAAGIDVAEDVEDWTTDTNESYRVDRASDYPFPIYRAMISAAQGDG